MLDQKVVFAVRLAEPADDICAKKILDYLSREAANRCQRNVGSQASTKTFKIWREHLFLYTSDRLNTANERGTKSQPALMQNTTQSPEKMPNRYQESGTTTGSNERFASHEKDIAKCDS